MTMTLPDAYARLREHFGTHGAAAKHLGMTEQHYNALRNGRANMANRTADYILLKAQEIAEHPSPPQSGADAMPSIAASEAQP